MLFIFSIKILHADRFINKRYNTYKILLDNDFPRPDLGPLKMSENLSKWYILVLHFGENFMKIQTKIAKLQMHENLH